MELYSIIPEAVNVLAWLTLEEQRVPLSCRVTWIAVIDLIYGSCRNFSNYDRLDWPIDIDQTNPNGTKEKFEGYSINRQMRLD